MFSQQVIRVFFAKIVRAPNGCWIWQSNGNRNSPVLTYKQKRYSCRKLALFIRDGVLPNDTIFDTCGTAKCVNPDHLIYTIEDRFWLNVNKTDTCWEWTGGLSIGGYGTFNHINGSNERSQVAHKFSYLIHYGPVPEGMCVCHHCDNRKCVRPDHLFLGTDADNATDMVEKGRQSKGEHRPDHKLTDENVRFILSSSERHSSLARKFGVSQTTILLIRQGKKWKHIPR